MQGWRGLEASRVKRYRLGKDRKIGSFGQWIPIYQHPPFSPPHSQPLPPHSCSSACSVLTVQANWSFRQLVDSDRESAHGHPCTYSWEHKHSRNVNAHTRSPEVFEPEMPVFEAEFASYSAFTRSNSAIAMVEGVLSFAVQNWREQESDDCGTFPHILALSVDTRSFIQESGSKNLESKHDVRDEAYISGIQILE